MTVTTFDFGELFTVSARPVISAALRRGLKCHFDYGCGPSRIVGDAQAFQRSFYRVIAAAGEVLRNGSLILAADVSNTAEDGIVDLHIDAAISGERQSVETLNKIFTELQLTRMPSDPASPDSISARGICPVLGAEVVYRCVPSAGALFSFSMRCRGDVVVGDLRAPNAHGGAAFIWHDPLQPANDLARRLHRLGWQVTLFHDRGSFEDALAQPDDCPRLVMIQESLTLSLGEDGPPAAPVDGSTLCILAVPAGSDTLGVADTRGWDLHILPLLPSELWDLTRRGQAEDDDVEENSRPTPLPTSARPRVLVVDDDEVNRVIASGLLHMIGYDSLAAGSGTEAIAMCEHTSPDVVLMDINMPGLDGYQTTAALQRLQRLGSIPPFPILAATAAGSARQSSEHGLDGHLSKPLLADDLRSQLQRALMGLATGL